MMTGSIKENFECLDCFVVAPLDHHGRCSRCLSDAVISEHINRGFLEEAHPWTSR